MRNASKLKRGNQVWPGGHGHEVSDLFIDTGGISQLIITSSLPHMVYVCEGEGEREKEYMNT